ncbi:MAG TPA: CheR family methyltransferase, partial [Kofleriaceae bacterium]|nr:CheR family methyltransferase [Kofleriaceae bacterium]
MTRASGTCPPEAIARVKASIAARAGLDLPDWVLASRLEQRLGALDHPDAMAYAELVSSDAGAQELELLLEALRVGETRFFRHAAHVKALTDVVIPALRAARPRGTVRAWSAGCASGEEPYTLAMVLRKLLPRPAYNVSVLATDLSAEAIEVARAGEYPATALAQVPEAWRSWAFLPAAADAAGHERWRIHDAIGELVSFERANLADGEFRRGFDIIWCRNVLIYFSREARQRVIAGLIDSLSDDGFLFVGYAESLRDFAEAEAVRTPDAVLYRKARATESSPPAQQPTTSPRGPARPRAAAPIGNVTGPVIAEEAVLELRGRYDGDRLGAELAHVVSGRYRSVAIDLDGAQYLADDAGPV